VFEVGDSVQIIYSGSTSNPSNATLSNGEFNQTSPSAVTLLSFGAATSYADTIQFAPTQGGSGQFKELAYTFQASQDWDSGSESGTAVSVSRSLVGVYPILVGMSAVDYTVGGNPYIEVGFLKSVVVEGNYQYTLTGSGFIYYLVPDVWSQTDLTILDPNQFDVTASFDKVGSISVTSVGLTNDWTQSYTMYKLQTVTVTAGETYTFNRN
jgi:hypothetical protein